MAHPGVVERTLMSATGARTIDPTQSVGSLPMMGSLRTKARAQFGRLESASMLLYALLLAWCIPRHESWFDEAQAWLIARDSSLVDLLVHRLHYEGSPGLWHTLLWIETRLGVPFIGMQLIAGALATAGVYVGLRYSPVPRAIKLLAPFTFYVIYQYAVVARSYVLAPLFVYGLLALYGNRKSNPMAFAVLAGLFANCSLHMAALSMGLVVLYAADRLWGGHAIARHRLLLPALVLVLLFGASAATAMPTSDGSSTTANPLVEALRNQFSHHVKAASPAKADAIGLEKDEVWTVPPAQGALATKAWLAINAIPAQGSPIILSGRVLKHLLVLLTAMTAPISTSNLLAGIFLMLLCISLAWARLWLALLPLALVQVCNVMISGEAHHIGLVWIAITAALWILWLQDPRGVWEARTRDALYGCVLLVMVLQIGWSGHALLGDMRAPYSSSKATAAFLATVPRSVHIVAFDDDSVTVNAYLPERPYSNQSVDYWPFSRTRNPSLFIRETMAEQPGMVILKMSSPVFPVTAQWVTLVPPGTVFVQQDLVHLLESQGYRETHRFCGTRFYRDTAESVDCRLIYERVQPLP